MSIADIMTLSSAWSLLGRDVGKILSVISSLPRQERVDAAEKILEKARRMAAKESAKHHPDKGGDPEKFKQIWEAFRVIELYTKDFREKMLELERKNKERLENKGIFIEVKK